MFFNPYFFAGYASFRAWLYPLIQFSRPFFYSPGHAGTRSGLGAGGALAKNSRRGEKVPALHRLRHGKRFRADLRQIGLFHQGTDELPRVQGLQGQADRGPRRREYACADDGPGNGGMKEGGKNNRRKSNER